MSKINWSMAFGVAIISDGIDYIGGFVPGVGDIIDVITAGILYGLTRDPRMAIGLTEVIPAVDFLPMWTGITYYAYKN